MGSNTCTFIALLFGHLYFSHGLQPPINSQLQNNWKVALIDAIISGNDIHDDIFEGDAINVSVDEAVQIAGEECCVDKICQQYDIIGSNRLGQLINVFKSLAVGQPHSCHVVITGCHYAWFKLYFLFFFFQNYYHALPYPKTKGNKI